MERHPSDPIVTRQEQKFEAATPDMQLTALCRTTFYPDRIKIGHYVAVRKLTLPPAWAEQAVRSLVFQRRVRPAIGHLQVRRPENRPDRGRRRQAETAVHTQKRDMCNFLN